MKNCKNTKKADVTENPMYHNTLKLLQKYRDVVWSLELSVQYVKKSFEIEFGSSIEEFLDSMYMVGADFSGTDIEHHAKCIELSLFSKNRAKTNKNKRNK